MKLWLWFKDFVQTVRQIAGAVAHARSHPTDLNNLKD